MREQTIHLHRPARHSRGRILHRVGLFLRHHRRSIVAMQWFVIIGYAFLVVVPAFLPPPQADEHIWNNLRLFAQFCFWGLWWPGVMLATATMGRVWCGLFCPEGTLTELASKYGLGYATPAWIKWEGWRFLAFAITTIYGQLVTVYEYPEAALLVLGGSTVVAVAVGLLFGREKRIWCRYLCPASGVFALLSRIAPLHYKVDRAAWDCHDAPVEPVNCAPLVDIRRMNSASECHMCGRCTGQREAVTLSPRSPDAELLDLNTPARTAMALTLIFGVLGIATAAFQWTVSPWFVQGKLAIAGWLIDHDHFALLSTDIPWWILTHHPNDTFSWLDGIMVLGYLLGGGCLFGAILLTGPLLAARLLRDDMLNWQRLSLTLTPLGATSVVLGLTMMTVTQLRAERFLLNWVGSLRGVLLAIGCFGALWLIFRLISLSRRNIRMKMLAFAAMLLPVGAIACTWILTFFVW